MGESYLNQVGVLMDLTDVRPLKPPFVKSTSTFLINLGLV